MTTHDLEASTEVRRGPKGEKIPPGVYWHHGRLWVAYYITGPDGRRVKHREATDCGSPREAGKLRAVRMTEHAKGERTVESDKLTVSDALAVVLAEYEKHGRRSLPTAKGHAKAIETALGAGTLAVEVADKADAVQLRWQRAGASNGTINRRCNLLRRGLRLLVRKRRLAFVPFIERLPEESEPARYITPTDADAIRTHLPEYARDIFSLALLLGIRRGQLSRTLRRYVDLDRGVVAWPGAECKSKAAHVVPLDADAHAIVEHAMDAAVPHCGFLFHGPDCKPGHKPSKRYGCLGNFEKPWRAAVKAAGLPVGRRSGGFVFHCTRSTFATDARAGGMAEDDCMKIGGWKTREVFGRYNLGDVEALRERLAASRGRRGKVVPLRRQGSKGA